MVCKMREQIQASRATLALAEERIGVVQDGLVILNAQITATKKQQVLEATQRAERQQQLIKEKESGIIEVKWQDKRQDLLRLLPPDLKSCLFLYLDIRSVARIECTCKGGLNMSIYSQFWLHRRALHGGGSIAGVIDRQTARHSVMMHGAQLRMIVDFIETLKEQRSVDKHRRVTPRRYVRHEPTITHPLPLLSLRDGQSAGDGKLMSRCETFNADFRSYAIQVLRSLTSLSKNPRDEAIYREMVQRSGLTVLVSLLSNEAGHLQQLACAALANLFACEAVRIQESLEEQQRLLSLAEVRVPIDEMGEAERMGGNLQAAEHGIQAPVELSGSGIKISPPFEKQMRAAEGTKMLFTLLSSPTATVNLVHGGQSAVQGMCNSDAARALVCLFGPKAPVRPVSQLLEYRGDEHVDAMSESPYKMEAAELRAMSPAWPVLQPWLWTYYSKSGSVKDSYVGYMRLSEDFYISGRGADSNGSFEIAGVPTQTTEGTVWVVYKAYLPMSEIFATSSAGSLEEWVLEDYEHFDGSAFAPSAAVGGTRAMLRTHVVHTLYFAAADGDGCFIPGFFGVWEMAGKEAHFQLDPQKGGVLRVLPAV